MKKLQLLKTVLLLCALIVGSGNLWAKEVLHYTLDGTITGGSSGYAEASDITQNLMSWKVTGNTTMSPWRIGGKSLSGVDIPIYSATAMSSAITKMTIEVGAASSITVNSLKLIVSSDADFADVHKIDEVAGTFSANSTITFKPKTPATEWATGSYYKIIFNVTVSGSSNKFVEFKNAKFYKEVSGEIASVTFADDAPSVLVAGTYTNTPTKSPASLVVTYASDDTDVATVDENTGEVTGVAPGKARITASWAAQTISATDYVAGSAYYDITVKGIIEDGIFNFQIYQDYGSGVVPSSTQGEAASTWTAGNVTMAVAGRNVWWAANNTLRLYSNSADDGNPSNAGNLTFSVPSGYYITKIEGLVSSNLTSTVGSKLSDDVWGGKSQSVTLTHTGTGGTITLSKITVYYSPETYTITMGADEWMTYCNPNAAVQFAGVKAYVVSAVGADVTLTSVDEVPVNTPVVLNGTAGTKTFTVIESAGAVSNQLKYSTGYTTGDGSTIYALAKKSGVVGFYLVKSGVTVPEGKAYLKVTGGDAREFIGFGDTTGIADVKGKMSDVRGEYYNLAGQRVAQPTKGLYIVNGKKVIIK